MARTTKYVMKSTAPPAELVAPSKFFGYSRVDKHFFTSQMTTNTESS